MKENSNKAVKRKSSKLVIVVVSVAFITGAIGGVVAVRIIPERITSLNNTSEQQKVISSQSELFSSIAKNVGPSVVSIDIKSSQKSTVYDFFGNPFNNSTPSQSAGTGIILSSDGVVMTNRHVIPENISSLSITTSDGKKYDNVEIIAKDTRTNYDVAFLKINNVNNLKPAKLGDSGSMQVGDMVLAIGNALGEFENTVTSGIISGKGRPVEAGDGTTSAESLTNLFQTDAAINPGNSGGPLVNMSGEVIGLNTAVASGAQNIGFSIPINDIKNQIASILKSGKLEISYLGIRYVILTPELKTKYQLSTDKGAWLKGNEQSLAVINGSPADSAGLKEGDIIIKIDGQAIDSKNPPASALGKLKVGDKVEIVYLRDDKEQKTQAVLAVSPDTK
ncbi:MAG: trypsin-like peptidase domain-containing protein [Candidatus Saccharibacteria bacterium]